MHRTTTRTHWGRKAGFEEVCTCGASSGPMPNPGFCSGWSADHRLANGVAVGSVTPDEVR
jgi:hypothetical protein